MDFKKLIKKKKGADVYEKEGLLNLAHLKSGVKNNNIDEIKIRKDGTLWLTPKVKVNYDFDQ